MLCLGSVLLVARYVLMPRVLEEKIKLFCENNAYFDYILAYIVMPGTDI